MLLQELSRSRLADAFRDMERLQGQINKLFDGYSWRAGLDYPPVNVWTNQDGAVVTAELPGVSPTDLDITVVNDTLTLRGERQPEMLGEGHSFHRQERGYGQFSRSIQLPFKLNSEKVEASFKHGILTVKLPRAEEDKPKKISICGE